jgi:hypothetical protein
MQTSKKRKKVDNIYAMTLAESELISSHNLISLGVAMPDPDS